MGIKTLTAGLGMPVLLLCAATATAQGARLNPCAEYQGYVDEGNADSLMARSFQKVCETVGHVELSNDCMTYYSFVNSFGEDSPMTQARAQACDASMPGLRDQVAAGPAPAPTTEPVADAGGDAVADTGGDTQADTGGDTMTTQIDQGGDQMADPMDDGSGSSADIALWDSIKDSDSPDMYEAYLNIYPDGLFAPIARIRIQNLQVQPEPEQQVVTEDSQTGASEEADGSAAEIAFWNSVKDSDSDAMLQTYLDAYPYGLFAPIAQLKIEQLQMAAAPQQPVADEPIEEPMEEDAGAATELAVWNSVKDSGSAEMLGTYLAAYPDGTFAPTARVMMDQLEQEAATAVEDQQTAQSDSDEPTAADLFKKANTQLRRASNATEDKAEKIYKRARRNFRKAADLGHVRAMMKLAEMQAEGLGGNKKNIGMAGKTYVKAARAGQMDAYEQALILLDENGRHARVVEVLVEFYKKRPKRAVDMLNTLSDKSIIAVQRMLKKEGYYFAALDADFGQLSERALRQYSRGAPKPTVRVVRKYGKVKAANSSALAAKMQRQLKRVWCYRGPIDGVWGAGSRNAMYNFNRWTGSGYAVSHPTPAAYNRVRSIRRPVCGVD